MLSNFPPMGHTGWCMQHGIWKGLEKREREKKIKNRYEIDVKINIIFRRDLICTHKHKWDGEENSRGEKTLLCYLKQCGAVGVATR